MNDPESGAFGQFGVGIKEALLPWKRKSEFTPPESAVEEATRFIGNLVGYAPIAVAGAALGPAAGVGALAGEGIALTARDLVHDYVEDDISTGNVVRHVAFNFVVPYGLARRGLKNVIKGKITGLEEPQIMKNYLDPTKPFDPNSISKNAKFISAAKVVNPETAFSMEGSMAPAKEFSYLMTRDPSSAQQVYKSLVEGSLQLKSGVGESYRFLQSTYTNLKTLDQLAQGVPDAERSVVKKVGGFLGDLLRLTRENSAIALGQKRLLIEKGLNGLTEAEKRSLGLLVENPDQIVTNPRLLDVVKSVRGVLDQVKEDAIQSGLKVRDTFTGREIPFSDAVIENYFPRYIDFSKLQKILSNVNESSSIELQDFFKRTMSILDREALTTGARNGSVLLTQIVSRQRSVGATSLLSRHGFDFHDIDPGKSLNRYLEEMTRSIETQKGILKPMKRGDFYKGFGLEAPEILAEEKIPIRTLATEILSQTGGSEPTKWVNEILDKVLHLTSYNSASLKASSFLRSVNILNRMILSPIGNLGGFSNTASVFGLRRSLQIGSEMLSGSIDQDMAKAAGAVTGDLATLMESELAGAATSKFLKDIGFTKTENILRTHAALTARSFILDTAEAFKNGETLDDSAVRLLDRLGITKSALDKGLNPTDVLRGMYRGGELTQFLGDVLNNPAFAASPMGKVFFQMKTFAYQQAVFMKRMIFDEMKNGNFKPALRILSAGTALGEITGDLKDLIRLRDPRERSSEGVETLGGIDLGNSKLNRVVDNILYAGYFGMSLDIIQSTLTGQGDLTELIGGPTVSMVGDISSALSSPSAMGKLAGDIGLTAATAVGVPGAVIARGAFPAVTSALSEKPRVVKKSFLASEEEKLSAQASIVKTRRDRASERIKKALSSSDTDRAYQIADEFNTQIEDKYGDSDLPIEKFRISQEDVRNSLIRGIKKESRKVKSFSQANLPPFFRG